MADNQQKIAAIRQSILLHEAKAKLSDDEYIANDHLAQADVYREIEQDYLQGDTA